MSCTTVATHRVLPAAFQPASPPLLIPCAPIESLSKPQTISVLWAFRLPPHTSAEAHMAAPLLLASLGSALNTLPVLCAALQEDSTGAATLRVDNTNPLLLSEATHPALLASCIPTADARYASASSAEGWNSSLIPDDLFISVSTNWTGPACSVQVTRFACGGVVLGLSAFHCLMDAQAAATFMREWGRQCAAFKAGMTSAVEPAEQPTFNRSFMLDGMQKALAKKPFEDPTFRTVDNPQSMLPPPGWTPPHVISRVHHFPRAELEAIRRLASAETCARLSAHDALYAHLIAVLDATAGVVADGEAVVSQMVNGRRPFGQLHFFGSCSFGLHFRTTHAAIQSDLPTTAAAIHRTHATVDRTALLAYNATLASAPTLAHVQLAVRIDFHVSSWRNCGMYDVDFGSGTADMAGPGPQPVPRLMFFAEGARGSVGEGGIDVWLSLEDEQWERMVQQGRLHRHASAAP